MCKNNYKKISYVKIKKGFVKGRYIGENIWLMNDMIHDLNSTRFVSLGIRFDVKDMKNITELNIRYKIGDKVPNTYLGTNF